MKVVGQLRMLKRLDLSNTLVTDRGLKELQKLSTLVHLVLPKQTSDSGLKRLTDLVNLEHLDLSATQVTDKGLTELRGFHELRFLMLNRLGITDEGVKELRHLAPAKVLEPHLDESHRQWA